MAITIQGSTLTGCSVAPDNYCDPYYNNVSLLLPMNGANNSTTFTDYSPSPKTVTPIDNTKISTAQYKFGGSSGYFDGSGDYLISPSSSAFDLSNQNFTIECWFRANGSGDRTIISNCDTGNNNYFTISIVSGIINYQIRDNTSQFITLGSISISNDTWYHLAWCRSGNNFYGFINGVLDQTSTSTKLITQRPILIGGFLYPGFLNYYTGYINDLRITKGVARYTSNFTPPATAFPTVAC